MKGNFSKRLLIGITGKNVEEMIDKINDIDKFKIKEVSIFFGFIDYSGRKIIYERLDKSQIKEIPLVHLRHDMTREEIIFFGKKYKTRCFTIHPDHLDY